MDQEDVVQLDEEDQEDMYGEELEEEEEDKDEDMDEESDYDETDNHDDHRSHAKISVDGMQLQPLNAQHLHNSHLYKRGPTKY